MYENDYMYAIERNDEYLAHYGIRGMKWGVRKAIASGNGRRLGRQYAKAQKKLAKLEKRAASGKKYARRAAALGAGAAVAGGLAAAGTHGIGQAIKKGSKLVNAAAIPVGTAMQKTASGLARVTGGNKATIGLAKAGLAVRRAGESKAITAGGRKLGVTVKTWGAGNDLGKGAGRVADAVKSGNYGMLRKGAHAATKGAYTSAVNPSSFQSRLGKVSNSTIARIGAGAVGAGLAGAAGYNAYRAATTKRAARKAAEFRSEMNKAFKGTQYDTSKNRQGKKRRRG